MQCKQCGHLIDPSAKFCPNCGGAIISQTQIEPGTCPKCGHPNQPSDAFCTDCGAELQEMASAMKTKRTDVGSERPSFRWQWAVLSIPIVFGVTWLVGIFGGIILRLSGSNIEGVDDDSRIQLSLLVSIAGILGLFLGGLVAAYWSKGRTIREPAVGIAAAIILSNFLVGNTAGMLLGWIFPLLLGMGGAWVGEWLQSRNRST